MLTVIIPFFRDGARLEGALDALVAQRGAAAFPVEIIAVDNDPEGGYAPPARFADDVRFAACAKPGSYAARNVGVGLAQGRVIAFTDADCLPAPGFLQAVHDFYSDARNDDALAAGNVTVVARAPGSETLAEAYDCLFGLPQESYVQRGYAVTANLSVPADVFRKVGLFDEAHFSGGDAELCRRAVGRGYRLIYNGAAEVFHPARRTLSELATKMDRVIGAQVDRAGLMGIIPLLARAVGRAALSFVTLLRTPGTWSMKAKAAVVVLYLSVVRIYYVVYHALPFSRRRR